MIHGVDDCDEPCSDSLGRLMAECSRTEGVFTAATASALGLTRPMLQRLTARAVIVREARGVYRVASSSFGFEQRLRVATALLHAAVFSHETAAVLWGFERFDTSVVHVTLSRNAQRVRPAWVVAHRPRRSVAKQTAKRRGLEVTTPFRTALDLAGSEAVDKQVKDFVDHCIASRCLSVAGFQRQLTRESPWCPGLGRLGRLLGGVCTIDSVAESRLVEMLVSAGIPRPVTQFELRLEGRLVARIDLAWPEQRVALELDGYRYHCDPQSFVIDRERGNRIVTAGWTLLRTTPATVRDDANQVVSEVQAALRRAGVAA